MYELFFMLLIVTSISKEYIWTCQTRLSYAWQDPKYTNALHKDTMKVDLYTPRNYYVTDTMSIISCLLKIYFLRPPLC